MACVRCSANCPNTSFLLQSNLPIRYEPVVFFGPTAQQIGECGPVYDARNRIVDLPPQILESGIGPAFRAGFPILAAFEKPVNLADRDGAGGPRQHISAFRSPPRFHKTALLQAGQDQFQKLLRDVLPAGDFGDLDRLAWWLRGKVEDRLQGIFTLYRNVHSAGKSISCIQLEIRKKQGGESSFEIAADSAQPIAPALPGSLPFLGLVPNGAPHGQTPLPAPPPPARSPPPLPP